MECLPTYLASYKADLSVKLYVHTLFLQDPVEY